MHASKTKRRSGQVEEPALEAFIKQGKGQHTCVEGVLKEAARMDTCLIFAAVGHRCSSAGRTVAPARIA